MNDIFDCSSEENKQMSLYRPFLIRSDIRTRYYQQLVISGARVVDEKVVRLN